MFGDAVYEYDNASQEHYRKDDDEQTLLGGILTDYAVDPCINVLDWIVPLHLDWSSQLTIVLSTNGSLIFRDNTSE